MYGDWVTLPADQPTRIDILVGEHPGGRVGGVLLLQQEGRGYERAENGRPILPVFTTQHLSAEERNRMRTFSAWRFDPGYTVMAPRAPAPAGPGETRARRQEVDDVRITIR